MCNLKLLFWIHFFIIIIFIKPLYGADIAKIAVVDTQKVLDKSLLGKKMQKELNDIGTKFSADLEAKGKEIQTLQKELEKLSSSKKTLSGENKEKFDKKTRELRIKIYDAEKLKKKYQNDFLKEETKRLKYTTEIIDEIIDEIGKMEMLSEKFCEMVIEALDSDKPIMVALHKKSRTPLLQDVRRRDDIRILEVTPVNRNLLPYKIEKIMEEKLPPLF